MLRLSDSDIPPRGIIVSSEQARRVFAALARRHPTEVADMVSLFLLPTDVPMTELTQFVLDRISETR